MSSLLISTGGRRFRVLSDRVTDISLPLDFQGRQPSHFGAPPARAEPFRSGGFFGDTRQGGSCNCRTLTLTPHCNGTHTESAAHLVQDAPAVSALATQAIIPALLISVPPVPATQCDEKSDPGPHPGDRLVTAAELSRAAGRVGGDPPAGLIIRTLPNDDSKRTRDYCEGPVPPYLSLPAAELVVSWGVKHLLVDMPSLDRIHDQGRLSAHRCFWGLPAAGAPASPPRRSEATVTEMVFLPDDLQDGLYALSLQIAPFVTDAAPSRPLLFPLEAA